MNATILIYFWHCTFKSNWFRNNCKFNEDKPMKPLCKALIAIREYICKNRLEKKKKKIERHRNHGNNFCSCYINIITNWIHSWNRMLNIRWKCLLISERFQWLFGLNDLFSNNRIFYSLQFSHLAFNNLNENKFLGKKVIKVSAKNT